MGAKFCRFCKKPFLGRSDKIFCSVACKSTYHYKLKSVTECATYTVDKYLHRNRSILLEIMGKKSVQKKVNHSLLDKKGFKYQYLTGYYENARGKRYHLVYDFAYMRFKEGDVLIVRRKKT